MSGPRRGLWGRIGMRPITVAAAAASVLGAVSLPAQGPQPSFKFVFQATVNYAWMSSTLNGPSASTTDALNGYALGGAFGWWLDHNWRLGVQADFFSATSAYPGAFSAPVGASYQSYTASATYYPLESTDLWARVNAGYGTQSITAGASGTAGGVVAGLAIGYDFSNQSRTTMLSPYVSYTRMFNTGTFGGSLSGQGLSSEYSLVQIGLTFAYGN
jgi:hypothetical protein